MDKRDLQILFRDRLQSVIARSGLRQAAFARTIGLDRSALSQLLTGDTPRLPRAETLHRIAGEHAVSLDWLMGLSQSDRLVTQVAEALEIEESADGTGDTRLAEWHREAIGYKIRYVPANIPDLLRTEEVIEYEYSAWRGARAQTQIREAGRRLDYNRRPETDMEVCMPAQRLHDFAVGAGVWGDLPTAARRRQLIHMADLLVELYPTFRLFLYDGLKAFSAPYTLFGPLRAALYLGDQYLVINTAEHIRALTNHFDDLIRRATVNPSECADHVRNLLDDV